MAKAPSNVVVAVGATTNEVLSGQIFWGLTTNEWGNQTGSIPTCALSSNTPVVTAGYYAATNLTEVDTDLTSTNIRVDVGIFGVTGTVYEGAVPKTGQTDSQATGDDGDLQKGVAWPVPRFTIGMGTNGTNLVTDNLTGLMWARNANMWGQVDWTNAVTNCNSLVYGGYDDWRLSNIKEFQSLIHWRYPSPAVPNTQGTGVCSNNYPFTGVQSADYWTSTPLYSPYLNYAWTVELASHGKVDYILNTGVSCYAWPVRGP